MSGGFTIPIVVAFFFGLPFFILLFELTPLPRFLLSLGLGLLGPYLFSNLLHSLSYKSYLLLYNSIVNILTPPLLFFVLVFLLDRLQGDERRIQSMVISFLWVSQLGIVMLSSKITHSRNQAKLKSCFANVRVLEGAVEMYNMDHKIMMKKLNMKALTSIPDEKGRTYLKKEPKCPGTRAGLGEYVGEALDGEGHVRCTVHGAPERGQ